MEACFHGWTVTEAAVHHRGRLCGPALGAQVLVSRTTGVLGPTVQVRVSGLGFLFEVRSRVDPTGAERFAADVEAAVAAATRRSGAATAAVRGLAGLAVVEST